MLAVTPNAFGEALLGVQIATELLARGDEVVWLAPAKLRPITDGTKIRFGAIDDGVGQLDRVLASVVSEQRCASVLLLDAASVIQGFAILKLDPGILERLTAPVIALDIWNLDESGVVWDFAGDRRAMDPRVLGLPRIVPVPFARPTAPHGYNAVPELMPPTPTERAEARAQLGLAPDDRMILWPSASWQLPRHQPARTARLLADAVPDLVVQYIAALGPRVRVVHVGPEPMRAGAALGARYRWLPQVPAAKFATLLGAADLALGLNVAATTIASAIALETPALVAVNARGEGSSEAVTAARGAPLGPLARAWVERMPGLYRFAVWPAGLYDVLAPVLRDNPFATAVRTVELLDEDGFVAALRALLFDDAAAAAARSEQRRYRAAVESLPSGAERFSTLLAEQPRR